MKLLTGTFFFVFLQLVCSNIVAQNALFQISQGIPLIANEWGATKGISSNYNFKDIEEAGIDAMIFGNMCQETYDKLKANNQICKIIPYQHFWGGRKGVAYYSERAYTCFEAEGNPNYGLNLITNNNTFTQSGVSGIKNAGSLADTIVNGPIEYGNLYQTGFGVKIEYAANFRMKIAYRTSPPPGIEFVENNDIVCVLLVTATNGKKYKKLAFDTLRVRDFGSINLWKTFTLNYNSSSEDIDSDIIIHVAKLDSSTTAVWDFIPNVKFKVYWTGLSYIDLYVDKITLNDMEGSNLVNNVNDELFVLKNELNYLLDPFNTNDVCAWYPIDEPNSIDNLRCISKLDSIVSSTDNNKHLMPAIADSWNDSFSNTYTVSKIDEFYKRGNYNGAKLNKYIFDGPWDSTTTNYKNLNLASFTDRLTKMRQHDNNFILSIQTGRWIHDTEPTVRKKIPSSAQFQYNINMGLLYGAKAIELNDYYYYWNSDTTKRTTLVKVHSQGSGDTTIYYTPLWHTLKDSVKPVLKGAVGKLLKKLDAYEQYYLNSGTQTIPSQGVTLTKGSAYEYDYGFFSNAESPTKKYIMLVARYYNPNSSYVNVTYRNLPNMNWRVKEIFRNSTYDKYVSNGLFTVSASLMYPGYARLLETSPVIEYGGYIQVNDTVKTSVIQKGKIQINASKKIYIKNCTYTINDTIIVKPGAGIGIIVSGNINFTGSGKIIYDNWNSSLFYTVENGHPKLIWGYQTGPKTYHIYKHTGGTWANIANISTTSTDTLHKQYYVDTEEEIYTGANYVRYKVIEGILNETNEVSIHVLPKELSEEYNPVTAFSVEQNYPNPFNPITSIKYSIPKDGKVNIKLYDMLGRDVKELFEGRIEAGVHNLEVNCSDLASGIYIYSIQYDNKLISKKMILLK